MTSPCVQSSARFCKWNRIAGKDVPPFPRHKSIWATCLVAGEGLGGACSLLPGSPRDVSGGCCRSYGCLATGTSATAFFLMKVFHHSLCDYLCWIPRRITSELPMYSSWLGIILHQNHFAQLCSESLHISLSIRTASWCAGASKHSLSSCGFINKSHLISVMWF